MGCGKSKLDVVATGNTVTRKKGTANGESSVKEAIANDNVVCRAAEGREFASPRLEQEKEECQNVTATNAGVKEEINNSTEVNNGDGEKENVGENGSSEEAAAGGGGDHGLISKESPDNYFSTRKDHQEAVEGGNSEYSSPRAEYGVVKLEDVHVEGELRRDSHQVYGEAGIVNTEEAAKEDRTSAIVEPDVSSAPPQKEQSADEEKLVASSAEEDLQTT